MRRPAVPAALVIVAMVSGVGSVVLRPHAPTSGPLIALQAPALSPRRLPEALTDLAGDAHLAQRLDGALATPPLRGACVEVRVAGAPVFARQASTALLPASNLKLLTALAALVKMGPQARFTTDVRVDRPPAAGVVNGPLWLVGGGDPLVITPGYRASQHEWTWSSEPGTSLAGLADKVVAAGVRVVAGGVVGDDSRYDAQRALPTWKPSYLSDGEVGAVGALVVDGGFDSFTHHAPAPDPALGAAAAFTTLLRQRGVVVGAAPAHGVTPHGATSLVSDESLPLIQLIGVMLRESDNLSAEMLVKELGARFAGAGSWAAGLAVVRAAVSGAGLPVSQLSMTDGSGLDRGDRATCDLVLGTVDGRAPVAAQILAGLPVAGRTGTLVQRMVGQAAAGRLRAKTGSLSGVAALTGEMTSANGADPSASLTFSLLDNAVTSDAAGRSVEDLVAAILATYPETPPAASISLSTP